MRNIGPKTQQWLQKAGIHNRTDLQEIGVVEAYLRLQAMGFQPTLNALWALEGALQDVEWRDIPSERKAELKQQVQQSSAPHPPER